MEGRGSGGSGGLGAMAVRNERINPSEKNLEGPKSKFFSTKKLLAKNRPKRLTLKGLCFLELYRLRGGLHLFFQSYIAIFPSNDSEMVLNEIW